MIFLGREKRSVGQGMLLFSVLKGVNLVNHVHVGWTAQTQNRQHFSLAFSEQENIFKIVSYFSIFSSM